MPNSENRTADEIPLPIAGSERALAMRDEQIVRLGSVLERLQDAVAARDERIRHLEGVTAELEGKLATRLGLSEDEVRRLRTQSDAQSMAFMVEMLPTFWNHLRRQLPGPYSVLDVGPGSGAGTQLLARIHGSDFLGYPLSVDAIDLTDTYLPYLRQFGPDINRVMNGDIFVEQLNYDYCFCSHVVEHVDDPEAFVSRLSEISRLATFVTAPFEEPSWLHTPGHINVFGMDRLKSWEPARIEIRDSFGWGNQDDSLKVFVVEIPGRG